MEELSTTCTETSQDRQYTSLRIVGKEMEHVLFSTCQVYAGLFDHHNSMWGKLYPLTLLIRGLKIREAI